MKFFFSFISSSLSAPFFLFPLSIFQQFQGSMRTVFLSLPMLDDIGVSKAHSLVFGGMGGGRGDGKEVGRRWRQR